MGGSYVWTEEEIDKLINYYADTPWQRMIKILPRRSQHAMYNKAQDLGLRKSRVGYGYHTINENFFQSWSPEMAYVLGVIAADGYVQLNRFRKRYRLGLTSKDLDWLQEIKRTIKAKHPIRECVVRLQSGTHVVFKFEVESKKIVQDLLKLGILPRKSLNLRFPNVPDQYLTHFVRGYFDGDGYVYAYAKWNRYPCIQLSFYGTKEFLTLLDQKIAKRVGCTIRNIVWGKRIYELRYNTREAEKVLRWMYRNAPICLPRKYRVFLRYMKAKKQHIYFKLQNQYSQLAASYGGGLPLPSTTNGVYGGPKLEGGVRNCTSTWSSTKKSCPAGSAMVGPQP